MIRKAGNLKEFPLCSILNFLCTNFFKREKNGKQLLRKVMFEELRSHYGISGLCFFTDTLFHCFVKTQAELIV